MPGSSTAPEPIHETPAEKLRDVVAGWIDAVAGQGERAIDAFGLRGCDKGWSPNVDVIETAEQVIVHVDLPGVDPEKVEIVLVGNMLTVKGGTPCGPAPAGQTVHRHERPARAFSRAIPLPVPVNPEKVSAESKHGVLTVALAKEESVLPRHIPIAVKTAGS